MSLIHRRRSVIFNNPETTCEKLKILEIINTRKDQLNIAPQSKSKVKRLGDGVQRLSLKQAKNIQGLFQKVRESRKISLNNLLNGFDKRQGIVDEKSEDLIEKDKLKNFRSGVYYKSTQRAKGAGIRQINKEQLNQYFNFNDQQNDLATKLSLRNTKTSYKSVGSTRQPNSKFSSARVFSMKNYLYDD